MQQFRESLLRMASRMPSNSKLSTDSINKMSDDELLGLQQRFMENAKKERTETERPKYKVVQKKDEYEIRRYAANVVIQARTVSREKTRSAEDNTFMKLAGFIGVGGAPQNKKQQAIAMTSPVLTTPMDPKSPLSLDDEQAPNNEMVMQFVLPSAMALEDVPAPENMQVSVHPVPEKLVAAIAFSVCSNASFFARLIANIQGLAMDEDMRKHVSVCCYLTQQLNSTFFSILIPLSGEAATAASTTRRCATQNGRKRCACLEHGTL